LISASRLPRFAGERAGLRSARTRRHL